MLLIWICVIKTFGNFLVQFSIYTISSISHNMFVGFRTSIFYISFLQTNSQKTTLNKVSDITHVHIKTDYCTTHSFHTKLWTELFDLLNTTKGINWCKHATHIYLCMQLPFQKWHFAFTNAFIQYMITT